MFDFLLSTVHQINTVKSTFFIAKMLCKSGILTKLSICKLFTVTRIFPPKSVMVWIDSFSRFLIEAITANLMIKPKDRLLLETFLRSLKPRNTNLFSSYTFVFLVCFKNTSYWKPKFNSKHAFSIICVFELFHHLCI